MPATVPVAPSAPVTLHICGECRIQIGGPAAATTTTLTPASDRLFTLTLLLAAEPGRAMPRSRAAEWLWPNLPGTPARHALRQLVYRLRRLGVPVEGDDAHLVLPRGTVAVAAVPLDTSQHTYRCLPGWQPPGEALGVWLERYRDVMDAATRTALAGALAAAPTLHRTRLAAALLELDPGHPLARAALPRLTAVREPTPGSPAIPCVGRDTILAALRTHLESAHDGAGATVVLTATPGVGVSRVLAELTTAARSLGLCTTTGERQPRVRTFGAVLGAVVCALLDRPGALGCSPHRLRALRRFAESPIVPTGHAPIRYLGAAIAELARAIGAERSLLLACDAPCSTAADRVLAESITRALADASVLVVFVAPADPSTFALLRSFAHVVAVPALRPSDAERLAIVAAAARGAVLDPDDLAWCVTMARGRPASVIALAEAAASRPGTRTLPPALATDLRSCLAALPARTRQVAALCALIGDPDAPDRAARALGRRRSAIDAALGALARAELPGVPRAASRGVPSTAAVSREATRVLGAAALATLDPFERVMVRARAASVTDDAPRFARG